MSKEMRKVRTGSVVRTGQDKTAVVEMVWKQRHRLYRKQVRRVARFHVHDPQNQCQPGDVVRIQEVRPISKSKRWRLLEIMERRQVAEVRPIELEADAQLVVETEEATELNANEERNGSTELEEVEVEETPIDELEEVEVEETPIDEEEVDPDELETPQDGDEDAPLPEEKDSDT